MDYRRPDLGPFISWYGIDDCNNTFNQFHARSPSQQKSARRIAGLEPFINWFQSKKEASIDTSAMVLINFPEHGRGAVALEDLPEGYLLFTIPRSLTLSTRTSALPSLLGEELWAKFRLGKGWVGLILCIMWEKAQGSSSKWDKYLDSLPTSFDTPMFWNSTDLKELTGTSVVEKIGKEEAERNYHERLMPAILARPDLFPSHLIASHCSMEQYHITGSQILSRSFSVEKWGGNEMVMDEDEDEEAGTEAEMGENLGADNSVDNAMDVDGSPSALANRRGANLQAEEDSDDEDSSDTAMVPMADMLNARYGSENAKLFHEANVLKMITTKPIKAGEQIYNTYGDLPNSDLLRRYGHVDLLPLPQGTGVGNPGDVVEIRADLLVDIISGTHPLEDQWYKERIDWWLEEGGDDIFVLETDAGLPEALISLTRLLMLPPDEWTKTRDKGKLPKPKADDVVFSIIRKRLELYPTSVQLDEELLEKCEMLSLNKRHATIVRLGEKRILNTTLSKIWELLKMEDEKNKGDGSKRKASEQERERDGNKKRR